MDRDALAKIRLKNIRSINVNQKPGEIAGTTKFYWMLVFMGAIDSEMYFKSEEFDSYREAIFDLKFAIKYQNLLDPIVL